MTMKLSSQAEAAAVIEDFVVNIYDHFLKWAIKEQQATSGLFTGIVAIRLVELQYSVNPERLFDNTSVSVTSKLRDLRQRELRFLTKFGLVVPWPLTFWSQYRISSFLSSTAL